MTLHCEQVSGERPRPKLAGLIAISATNPCHLYDLAVALHAQQALGAYHSGYPAWKLRPPVDFPLHVHSFRTLMTYGCLRLPLRLRPANHRLFRWQDAGFDLTVARHLSHAQGTFIHAMPGQALATFRRAKELGLITVLNHASGPVRQQLSLLEEEYHRAGIALPTHHGFDNAYFTREEEEYSLADRHCVASSVVCRQLQSTGIPSDRIWIVPYGADMLRFHPPQPNAPPRDALRIVYAGQLTLRKGLRIAFDALREVRHSRPVVFDLYGTVQPDIVPTLAKIAHEPWIHLHPPVDREKLAGIFRQATLLLLPSWEEAFGLVVPQALNCGLPCIVSDRVGAADLIEQHRNGSIFPVGESAALSQEIDWWLQHPHAFRFSPLTWDAPAQRLIELSAIIPPV